MTSSVICPPTYSQVRTPLDARDQDEDLTLHTTIRRVDVDRGELFLRKKIIPGTVFNVRLE